MNRDYAVVIATCDRTVDLIRLLVSLARQTALPVELVIVDASDRPVEATWLREKTGAVQLSIAVIAATQKGLVSQRNQGISAISSHAAFVLFLDDDTELSPTFSELLLEQLLAEPRLVAAGGNIVNDQGWNPAPWQRSVLNILGIAPSDAGFVLPSGAAVLCCGVDTAESPRLLENLAGGALMVRRCCVVELPFDVRFQRFGGYAAYEDLDYSLCLGRRGGLLFVPSATLLHFKSAGGERPSPFWFGVMEVWNRAYLVHKHMNHPRNWAWFYWAHVWLLVNHAIRLNRPGLFKRLCGNVYGLLYSLYSLCRIDW